MPKPRLPVLYVDDDPVSHQLIDHYLQDWDIEHVFSGEDALEMLNRKNFIIVVTDLRMPGMDGLELLKEIKRTYGNRVKVIVVTVSEEGEDLLAALDGGASDFLLKPLQKARLQAVLEETVLRINRWTEAMDTLVKKKKVKTSE